MSQYQARLKALQRKRDGMIDLFTDAKIKRANKPVVHGNFFEYVVDLDREAALEEKAMQQAILAAKQQLKQAQAVEQQAEVKQAVLVSQPAKPDSPKVPEAASDKLAEKAPDNAKATMKEKVKQASDFWEKYTE